MMLKVFLAVVLLCSPYCLAQNDADLEPPGDDKSNWEEVFKVMSSSNYRAARSMKPDLGVFDTILRVNARERGSGLPRSDTDVFLFEGDIVVKKSDITANGYPDPELTRQKRAATRNKSKLWPRTIHFVLDKNLGKAARKAIESAIAEWLDVLPCMAWAEIISGKRPSFYLHFFAGAGCYSKVGRVGNAQKISIGTGCEHHGIVVHEIGHAMGLWHEQSRPDRDYYVWINWNNIIPAMKYNFQKRTTWDVDSLGVSYDYDSVMHASSTAFAKASGLQTISSLRGHQTLGQRHGLSTKDKQQVQLLYRCWKTVKPTVCKDSSSHKQWCIESKNLSFCSNTLFKKYMKKHCCNTCKPKPTPPKPKGYISLSCVDKNPKLCRFWKKDGYCYTHKTYSVVKCPKSCNFCT